MLYPTSQRIWLVLSHVDNRVVESALRASPYTRWIGEDRYTGVDVELFAVDTSSARRSEP
jgi:hypothetical protein